MLITIQTTINADVNKVWDFYTNPKHIVNWNFATDDWFCPKAENNLKVGGKYLSRMEAKDGSFGFDFEGIYDEVIFLKKISYTILDGRRCSIIFTENTNQTIISISFDTENQNPVEMQRDGWQAILDNFKKYVELNKLEL